MTEQEIKNSVLEEAVDALDRELEDGSPVYTWSDSDHAINDARIRAIEAIRALKQEGVEAALPEPRSGDTSKPSLVDDAEVMRIWRECGLPEYFLGNGGSNHKLVAFAKACCTSSVGSDVSNLPTTQEDLEAIKRHAWGEGYEERGREQKP